MNAERPFVDYYDILQVDPGCDPKILESAYHYLAKLYHPDHGGTADTERFSEVIEAYRILRNPDQRAEYDLLYSRNGNREASGFPAREEIESEEQSALADADDHARILLFLYKKRRENAQNAGVVGYYLQSMLNCSDEHFEFHKWYLKEKGFVVLTEQGTLAITIQGVDHVISMSRTTKAEKLMISKSSEPGD
jgi:curved DNA-binding protein